MGILELTDMVRGKLSEIFNWADDVSIDVLKTIDCSTSGATGGGVVLSIFLQEKIIKETTDKQSNFFILELRNVSN